MESRIVSGIAISLLLTGMLALVFSVRVVDAYSGFSDEFDSPTLKAGWAWDDPGADCEYSLTANSGYLRISASNPGNDLYHYTNRNAPRMMQTISGDFVIETKLLCAPQYDAQGGGILIWQDSENFLRLDRIKHMGTRQVVDLSGERAGAWNYFGEAAYSVTTTYLRLERNGDTFTARYSNVESGWTLLTSITFPFGNQVSIGVFIINEYQDHLIYADYDYFRVNGGILQGDLWIESIEPVQVVFGAPLVAGKDTMLRVNFTNTFDEAKLIHLTVTWGKKGQPPTVIPHYQLTVWPGKTCQFIPIWLWKIRPEVGTFVASATVEENGYTQSTRDITVVGSPTFKVLYVPVIFPSEWPLIVSGSKMDVERLGADTFLKATYPIAADKYASAGAGVVVFDPLLGLSVFKIYEAQLWTLGKIGGYNRVVAVVPSYHSDQDQFQSWLTKWFPSVFPEGQKGFYNEWGVGFVEEGYWTVVAHELGHSKGLWANGPEEYDVANPGKDSSGYWVHLDGADFNPGNGYSVSGPIRMGAVCFMGGLTPYQDYQYVYAPGQSRQIWIDNEDYASLTQAFGTSDPEVVLVSGLIYNNGTVMLNPWYRLSNGIADIDLGANGNYTLQFLNKDSQIIGQTGFNASFTMRGIRINMTSFNFAVPYLSNTTEMRIIFNGTVIASRSVSLHAPYVNLISPNGGEIFNEGDTVTLTWNGSDPDNDALVYSVLYSPDNGLSWVPVAVALKEKLYNWTIESFDDPRADQYLIKVVASDGVNTGEDVSDATFTVLRHDVAVTDISTTKTVVGESCAAPINITVQNQGNYTEVLTFEAYANTTVIHTQTLTLASGNSATVAFAWATTGFAKGNYMLGVHARTVPGEIDTADNIFICGNIIVAMVGDVDANGKVEIKDLAAIAKCYGANYPDPRYVANYDLDDNGKIEIKDLALAAKNYGKIDP